jgi:hypothetical protein
MSHTATPEQLPSVVAPLTVGGGVAPLTVGHFGSHGELLCACGKPAVQVVYSQNFAHPDALGTPYCSACLPDHHRITITPYVPGLDTDPSALARKDREIEALKAERDGLRERVAELEKRQACTCRECGKGYKRQPSMWCPPSTTLCMACMEEQIRAEGFAEEL